MASLDLFSFMTMNETSTTMGRKQKQKKEIVKAPRVNNKNNDRAPQKQHVQRSQNHKVINSLLKLSQNTIDIFFSTASLPSSSSSSISNSNTTVQSISSSNLQRRFINFTENIEEDLQEWIRKIEKQNPSLIKTVAGIFSNAKERYEFYLLRFLCNAAATMNIFEIENRNEEERVKYVSKNFIIDITSDYKKKKLSKKSSISTRNNSSQQEKDFIHIRLHCPSKNNCMPYVIQNGKLHQSKYGSNVRDKYVVYCLYALVKYIRNNNNSDSRIIVVNCLVYSIYEELFQHYYYCQCIRNKYKCIINYK